MTRIAKGKQAGELWDKVILPNGMLGYVFQNYLKEVPNVQIEQIKLSVDKTLIKKGESQKATVTILPEEAKDHEIEYSSSNPNIVTIDNQGNMLGIKSGIASITAKAKENSVATSILVQVYTPVLDMQVNVESLVMQEGDGFIITPIITPSDADNQDVIYTSENEEIAIVDNAGNIIAVKEGNAKIIVQTKESNIKREIEITVVPKIDSEEIIFHEQLNIEHNEITGWDTENLSVNSIKDKIKTPYTIKIYNKNGEELKENQFAGTGSKIRLMDENNIIKMEYYIIIYGDVNGDGKINSTDLLVLQRHILEIEKLKGVFLKAGNINKNGKNPSSLDSLLIQRHILQLKLIEQKAVSPKKYEEET